MKSERWREIEKLYHAALELEEEKRPAFLDQVCAGDEALRRELESLLEFEDRAENFIESPALEVAASLLAKDQDNSYIGSNIGPYQVLSLIGEGGMGKVYLAEDTRLGRKLALKMLPKGFTQETDRVRRFEQEARAASALNHPNIITIFEIGRVDDAHYIATEYIEGQTLRQRIKQSRLELNQALDITCQIAGALQAAHEAGIVHRDIKPENIMLRPDGYVKVLDFGIAKLTENYTGALDLNPVDTGAETALALKTETGVVLGTTSYMSPEQARGLKIDARTDLFSLGVVIYEMIGDSAPFTGPTGADVLAAILAHEPPPVTTFLPEAPEALDWIVAKTLRKNRAERYQTAKELLGDIKGLKQRLEFEEELKRSMGSGAISTGIIDRVEARSTTARIDTSRPHTTQSRNVIDSLAVMPLVNTLADAGMEYFSDGITESIINALSRLPELHVMAWSTVSRYKNRQVDPRQVGRKLGVRAVLTGRVIQLGDNLVIKTELVDANDGSHLWGENYTCKPSDIFHVEAEISKEISEKLLLRLTAEERSQLTKRATDNLEAYHAYLKGRYFWNKRTDESLRQGIIYFREAIDRDPCYALAYVGLADSYSVLGSFGIATLRPRDAFPIAREAAVKALEIDDTLAEAHLSLAYCLANYYWEWAAAEREFKRALELKPGYATAHHWYGFCYLVAMGQLDEAIREAKRAHELDPLSLPISSNVGFLLYLARQYDQAIDQFAKTLEMEQNFVYSHWERALAYEQKEMYGEAIAGFEKAIALSGKSTLPLALLGRAYALSGKKDEARAVLDQLKELAEQRYVSPYRVAAIYAALGEKKLAFEWLDRAYEERDGWLIWLKYDPVADPIRSDRRFKTLLRTVGLAGSTQPTQTKARRKAITSLAILPFVNLGDDPNLEYFSDGITESIINTLSQLPRLRVVARSTVFRYKGGEFHETRAQSIGRELGVQAVLMGRVRHVADRLTIAAELISVADDSQLWGEHYSRNLSDIFEVQEEIAREITGKLRLKLSRKDKGRINRRHTENVEAYQAYLKGRYFWNKRTIESLNKGTEYFKQAIDIDPAYALAYTGLSDSYTLLVVREAISPEEGFAKAKAAAAMALKIYEEFTEAHASLGHAMLHNWEWEDAERELKRAIELNPGYPSAHHWYSEHLTAMGRCEESITELKLAERLDPLSVIISADLGRAFYYARDYDQVMKQEARTLEMDPGFWLSHINMGRSYTQKGMHAEAIDRLQKASELSAGNTEVLSFLGFAYAAAGRTEEALETLRELDELVKSTRVPPYHLAIVHAGLGDKDQAFAWLERAFEMHAVDLFTLKVEPMFDGLRADQRFDDLLRRMGIAVPLNESKNTIEREPLTSANQAKPAAIAVLPFRSITAEGRDEYLELGIADALITKLSDINQIVVRPISSVRKYTDLEQDSVTAGRELGVEAVLEASMQKLVDRIRITARLVKVEDGRSLWTGKIDEKFTDLFAVEDSISEKVAAALALKLTGQEKERLAKRYTENTAAYHLYLKGRYYWNKRSEDALHKSIDCYYQAIEIDPNYALAYGGLADAFTFLGDVGITAMPPREAFLKGRAAAVRALEIDDTIAEAHASLGHLNMHDFQWADARKELTRALELKPNYATTHQWYAFYLLFTGSVDEAFKEINHALWLDPLSQPISADVAEMLFYTGRYDQSLEQFRKTLEIDPRYARARLNLGQLYEQLGMRQEAVAEFQTARSLSDSPESLAALAHVEAISDNRAEAIAMLEELSALGKRKYVSPFDMAMIYAGLGDNDRAFEWLDKGYDERAGWMIYITVDPRLESLRSDARFASLRARVGL